MQPWEILGSIAEALGSSMDDLVRYDRIRNPDLILASERLRIPNPNIVWHSYGIRLKSSWGVSCCLRPPMVVGQIPYRLGLIEQLDATLHQRIFYFEDLLEESVGYGLIAQRP